MENQEVMNEALLGDDHLAADKKVPTPGEVSFENEQNPNDGQAVKNERVQQAEGVGNPDTPDMFPRKVVEGLRKEAARYRERAKAVDVLEQRLHEALVRLDGRLADPKDLAFDAEHLEDPDKLAEAITALVEKNPRLKAMQIAGDAGQGARGPAKPAEFSFIRAMRGY